MGIQYLQLFLSLCFLIILHELGHFIPAKLFKARVEKFYLFFDPGFSILKKKIGETEYGIGWLPLGGYVKIAGMIDESMDTEFKNREPQEWELRAKPAWQRLIVMMGGIIVNVIVAIVLYGIILFTWGEKTLPIENVKYGIECDSVGFKLGLKDGDNIIGYDHQKFNDFFDIPRVLLLDQPQYLIVERAGQEVKIPVTKVFLKTMVENGGKNYFQPRMFFIADSIIGGFGAEKAGMKKGDQIIAVNGDSVKYFSEIVALIKANTNKNVAITFLREGDRKTANVFVNEKGQIGIFNKPSLEIKHTTYGFFESFPAGIAKSYQLLVYNVQQYKIIFDSEIQGYKQVRSVIGMADAFPSFWNWQAFWSITAFISIALAFMNFLPIPGLDGGHVMFIMYELISGKKPSEKVMEVALKIGMIFLITLMVFVLGRDILEKIF